MGTRRENGGEGTSRTEVERFEFESLEAFRLAVEAAGVVDDVAMRMRRDRPWVAGQLGRASVSVVANIGEGSGEHSAGDKARFYRYARRSATETAAILVFLSHRLLLTSPEETRLRRLLLSTIRLLTRMILRLDGIARARTRGWKDRKF